MHVLITNNKVSSISIIHDMKRQKLNQGVNNTVNTKLEHGQ